MTKKKYSTIIICCCCCILILTTFICLEVEAQQNNNNILLDPILLYSTSDDIRIAAINNNSSNSNKFNIKVLIRNITEGAAIDYHYAQKRICWTDHGLETIQCVQYTTSTSGNNEFITIDNNKIETITNDVLSPVGLACDWFTNKLYWTDSDTNRIEVVTMEGLYRKVLFWTDIDQPRALALVPMKGLMFWTDWGEIPKIERADMNGNAKSRTILVSDQIFWPNGLTCDYERERIYWIDGRLHFIEMMTYDGKNRTIILDSKNSFDYPFALTMFAEKLFWTDWQTWSINLYDQQLNRSQKLIHSIDSVPMDIHVFNEQRQPLLQRKDSLCDSITNGGCSHLCLLQSNAPYYSCACPIGIKLIDNLTCAQGPQELLLLAKRTDICVIYLDSPDYTHKILPLNGVKYTIAVDYDPIDDYIYWSDDEVKKIQKARLNGSDQQDVVSTELQHPDGIAIDWQARNLYWTDAGTDRVEVVTIFNSQQQNNKNKTNNNNNNYRTVIISDGLYDPRGIAVASELGWLFWSDWYEKDAKIERSNLDGSERQRIVTRSLGWPNGITLDLIEMKIYWCDAQLDKIEYANMDGSDRRELINDNVPHVFGFSLMNDFLYWTDWQRRTINRAHKESGGHREVIVDQMPNVMGLKAISFATTNNKNSKTDDGLKRWNPCSVNNGNCSQICLYRHNKTRICACQLSYELSKDRMTCVKPDAFLLYTKKDSIRRISLENNGNNEMIIPISGLKHVSAIDFDVNTMRIYWSDSKLRTIMRSFINGSDPQRLIDVGLYAPEDIAIDWLGLNIYWTDSLAHRIEVSRLVGTSRRTLLWGEVNEPHSIVLDPLAGYMYWSEWSSSSNAIKKAFMDGSYVKKLISTYYGASDLTLDYQTKRLYWIEIDSILSSDLNGNDKRLIVNNKNNDLILRPIGLTLYKDYLYFVNDKTKELVKVNKTTIIDNDSDKKVQINIIDHLLLTDNDDDSIITDLNVFYTKQIGSLSNNNNQCAISNGGCTHLCLTLPSDNGPSSSVEYTCACPTHYILTDDNKCNPPKQFMIYSQKNLAVRLLPDTSDCPEAVLSIQGLKSVKAIDFDPVHNFLYWIEGKTQSIKRSEANSFDVSIVVVGNSEIQPYDLVIDTIGRLLFWTCALQNVINVTRLDNNIPFNGVVVQRDNEKPRLLALHSTKRLLFYTDVGQTTSQLIRTRLDGSHRIIITRSQSDHNNIAALAVDPDNDLIVWTQGQSIYISNIDGENQHVLLNESNSRITQLTIYAGWLYWIDREFPHQLQRLELISGKSRSTLAVQASHIVDMISVVGSLSLNHSCAGNVLKCSHLCILNSGGTIKQQQHQQAICACPVGFVLNNDDKRTCIPLVNCGADRFTCTLLISGGATHRNTHLEKDCIPISWRCDRQKDCDDNSDELNCPPAVEVVAAAAAANNCDNTKTNQYKCLDGSKCIDAQQVCDSKTQCPDNSDEINCCSTTTTTVGYFQCVTMPNVCLPDTYVCDGTDNCMDGSDEDLLLCNSDKFMTITTTKTSTSSSMVVLVIIGVFAVFIGLSVVLYSLLKKFSSTTVHQQSSNDDDNNIENSSLNPMQQQQQSIITSNNIKAQKLLRARGGVGGIIPDVVRMSMLNNSQTTTTTTSNSYYYDRNHITGASSSSNCTTNNDDNISTSLVLLNNYPHETLNPPPSPATTAASTTRGNSPITNSSNNSRYYYYYHRPYRHYRAINQPPPPTPCSTDVCDESDCNNYYSLIGGGDAFPPPSTPHSETHCCDHSDDRNGGGGGSCPPSPSSRSSTYFSPLPPPPPSPVTVSVSPPHYHHLNNS